jgi:hypothetical protein
MNPTDHLSILSETIATHARKFAYEEWENKHREILLELFRNGQATDTLNVDGREIPVEAIAKAIREQYLAWRSEQLAQKLLIELPNGKSRKHGAHAITFRMI